MIERSHKQLVFERELQFVDNFVELIRKSLRIEAQIKIHSVIEGEKQTKAYRIRLSNQDVRGARLILATDFDDTLEKYTKRKDAYHQHLAERLLEVSGDELLAINAPAIIELLGKINKIARCLPPDRTHPEYYVPKLELLLETHLLELAQQDVATLVRLTQLNVQALREYFVAILGSELTDLETIVEKDKDGHDKAYFREQTPLAMEIVFEGEAVAGIDQELWQLFVHDMTGNNLDPQEVTNLALPDDIYWLITTFGSVQFQIRKIVAGLMKLQAQGQRLPDELVVITQGRKDIFLQELFVRLLQVVGKKIVYLDDSKSQLESVTARLKDAVICYLAVKLGAARTAQVAAKQALVGVGVSAGEKEPVFSSVQLDETPLKELVAQWLQ